jgi:tetratricopeptide (TPR) repeat protein
LKEIGLDWRPRSATALATDDRPAAQFRIESAPWEADLRNAADLVRTGDWAGAAAAYRRAIDAGVADNDIWPRLALMTRLAGDEAAYRSVCRDLLAWFDGVEPAPKVANNLAWACALGPDAVANYERVIEIATRSVESSPELNRLNTLGAVLYRAGRYEQALTQLRRSIDEHAAGGTPYDGYLIAMTHFKLGHIDDARAWLARTLKITPIAMRKPDTSSPSSWIPQLELGLLRSEAQSLIGSEP